MNTQFIDIAATITTMVQNGLSRADAGAKSSAGENGRGFEDRYQNEINRIETAGKSGNAPERPVREKVREPQAEAAATEAAEAMDESSGVVFLSKLEQTLRKLSGGDLKGMVMDASGLEALKKLLLKAGFDPEEVESLVAELKEKSGTKSLNLDEVFAALSELVVEVDEKASPETVYMETSALPFIKTLLTELGLTEEEIADITGAADQGTQGISLNAVIEKLKAVEAAYRESGQTLGTRDSKGSFQSLMAQLNLPVAEGGKEVVTINDLIRAFEAVKDQQERLAEAETEKGQSALAAFKKASDSEPAAALLNRFFQSVSTTAETVVPGFSYQQVKDQFVNEMMIPAKDKAKHKGLFAQQVKGADAQTDALLKEMVTLLSKGPGSHGDDGALAQNGRRRAASFGKELKGETGKLDGIFQGNTGTGNDIEGSGNIPRAKAPPRTLPAYVTHQVGRGIVRAMNQGERSLTLQLKPAELGRLTMTIDHQSTGIKVNIVTENQSARDMLASNVNELKAALHSAGISLDSFDVDMNSDFRQSMANAGNQTGGRKNGGRQGSDTSAQGGEAQEELLSGAGDLVTDGSYHFVA